MEGLRCTIMRGGTSKAVFLREDDPPPPGPEPDRIILRVLAGTGRNHGVRRATLGRTARRILDGTVYLEDAA